MRQQTDKQTVQTVKVGLTVAFSALRKQGIIARQNFLCCQSCASSALSGIAVKQHTEGKPVNGVVYYHRQDNNTLKESGYVYLAYGDVSHYEEGKPEVSMGLPTIEVGKLVVKAVAATGLKVDWDGNEGTRIKVYAEPGVKIQTITATKSQTPSTKKPVCKLIGTDSNVFFLGGKVSTALRNAGQKDKIQEFQNKLTSCGSYETALILMGEYVEIR